MIESLIAVVLLGAAVWFWSSTMSSRDTAQRMVAEFCRQNRLQLLDQTVALRRVSVRRKPSGSLGLVRIFRFDYSDNGFQRRDGIIWMLANRPFRIAVQVGDREVLEELPPGT